jgi:hypothetical protein
MEEYKEILIGLVIFAVFFLAMISRISRKRKSKYYFNSKPSDDTDMPIGENLCVSECKMDEKDCKKCHDDFLEWKKSIIN